MSRRFVLIWILCTAAAAVLGPPAMRADPYHVTSPAPAIPLRPGEVLLLDSSTDVDRCIGTDRAHTWWRVHPLADCSG